MTTSSYPVKDQNIDHAMWRQLFSGTSGFFDPKATGPFGLTLSATTDTATVGLGRYGFRGFVLQVTAAHDLTLAAAGGSPVTYTIGIMYDPALEGAAAGPLYLAAPVKTSITVPSGGDFCPLWDVTRQPAQVLSQAATVDRRQWAYTPALRVGGTRPAASEFAYGQVLLTDAYPAGAAMWDAHVRQGGAGSEAWEPMFAPQWNALGVVSSGANALTQAYSTVALRWTRSAGQIVLEGAVARVGGADFAQNVEYTVTTFGPPLAPSQSKRFIVDTNFTNVAGQGGGRVSITGGTGVVTFKSSFATPVFCLDGVSWFPKGA